jgi:hypothetical protein
MIFKKFHKLIVTMALLLMVLLSCKKNNESIKRDIIISQTSEPFVIPISTDTLNNITYGKISMSTTGLEALIKAQDAQFGLEDITSIKISGFKFALVDTNAKNNLANFSSFLGKVNTNSRDSILIASALSIAEVANDSLIVATANQTTEMKPYFNGTALNYTLSGILRHATTKTLNSRITPQYTIKLEK